MGNTQQQPIEIAHSIKYTQSIMELVVEKIEKALKYGWYFEKTEYGGDTTITVLPPKSFDCANWGAIWEKYDFHGLTVRVPYYLYNADINSTVITKGYKGISEKELYKRNKEKFGELNKKCGIIISDDFIMNHEENSFSKCNIEIKS